MQWGSYQKITDQKKNPYNSVQSNILRETVVLVQGYIFRIEREIDDVVDIMKDNIDKTMQRGDRLDDLQDKSGKGLRSYLFFRFFLRKMQLCEGSIHSERSHLR